MVAFLACLVAFLLFVLLPFFVLKNTIRVILRVLRGEEQLREALGFSRKVLCYDCCRGMPVVSTPQVGGSGGEPPRWRVPIDWRLPSPLDSFLEGHLDWVDGFGAKHRWHLSGLDPSEWHSFAEFINRELARAGLRQGLLRRPARLAVDDVRKAVFHRFLVGLWEPVREWLDEWVAPETPDLEATLARALVDEWFDAWQGFAALVQWHAEEQRLRVNFRRVRKFAAQLLTERQDTLHARELTRYAQGIALHLDEVDALDPYAFEALVGDLYGQRGYEVTLNGRAGDQGADLVLMQHGAKTVVQVKLYANPVGNKAVQEVIAARTFYTAQEAIVVTNSTFTRSAVELACAAAVQLVDREGLRTMIADHNGAVAA